jgi:outer membrane receptor protein involved in Fe transport
MPLIFSVVLPTLVSVAVLDVTQEQMMTWGIQTNPRLVGESTTSVPDPLRETVCGLPVRVIGNGQRPSSDSDLRGSKSHTDSAAQYSGLSTTPPVGVTPGYSWTDLDLRLTNGRYNVSLYAKNLFDKRVFNSGGPFTDNRTRTSSFGGIPIQPRVVGLDATLRF